MNTPKSPENIQDTTHEPSIEARFYAEGKSFEIPHDGCLGLLALGAVGLVAWRHKRHIVKMQAEHWHEKLSKSSFL